ncbi:MAG: AEC family transporter [Desulfobulbaceae bacterium]|uniref:AEC family transporter n=1 Tax=Candidatus Desulfobia pelagia TaxID=2841692 RepID=A0A8J6NBD4_9BACT|nr:AEC family transporter [Candidatus Desulfobia pelagia]
MLIILEAVFPVFSLIVIGAIFRRIHFPGDTFWPLAERLTYFVLFPALLVTILAGVDIGDLPVGKIFWPIAIVTFFIAAILLFSRRYLAIDGPSFTSVFQGSIRPNTYIGLAACSALYGDAGMAVITVALAVLIPLVNLLSVLVLTYYRQEGKSSFGEALWIVIKNPLIIACGIGVFLNKTGTGLPYGSFDILSIFARAALPLGLLSVGASLGMISRQNVGSQLLLPSALKLVVFPVFTALACLYLGVAELVLACAVLFTALPGSASSYILASQLGGNKELMSGIITVETVASALTIPCLLMIFG